MVVELTPTYAMIAFQQKRCEFESSSILWIYSIQHYVIQVINDLRQVSGFFSVLYAALCDNNFQLLANVSGFFFLCTTYSILFVIKFVNNLRNIYVFFLLCTLYNIRWYSLSMICGRSLVFSVYSVQHYVILFVNDLRKVSCFFQCNLYSIIW